MFGANYFGVIYPAQAYPIYGAAPPPVVTSPPFFGLVCNIGKLISVRNP